MGWLRHDARLMVDLSHVVFVTVRQEDVGNKGDARSQEQQQPGRYQNVASVRRPLCVWLGEFGDVEKIDGVEDCERCVLILQL